MKKRRTFVAMFSLISIAGAAFSTPLFAYRHDSLLARWILASAEAPRVSKEKSGTLPTKDGLALRLDANLGDIRVFTDTSGQVSYRAVAQADARATGAESVLDGFAVTAKSDLTGITLEGRVPGFNGRIWVTYELHVPRRYDLVVNTGAGDIQVQDIDGRVTLATAGGKIAVGNVNPFPGAAGSGAGGASAIHREVARLDTEGGDILIGDVSGNLHAVTAGGHITAGNVSGKALLRTGGGSIRAGHIQGPANLDTGGGAIRVASVHSKVTATTAGGQIDFGEVVGTIHAHSGGGAVRIERTSGPVTVDASDGNIFLRQVEGPVDASSTLGSITAWLTGGDAGPAPGGESRRTNGNSQFVVGDGNIIVYLPPALPATVDAVIEQGGEQGGAHRFTFDPSLPLHVDDQLAESEGREQRYHSSLNGGGEILSLKTVSGSIFLQSADSRAAALAVPPGWPISPGATADSRWNPGPAEPDEFDAQGFIDEVRRMFEMSWWGVLPVDSAEMQKRLVHSVVPEYPDVARKAGVEGDVVLRVYVASDGRVESLRTLEGPPILARAAEAAVQQWRFRPVQVNGRPTSVVTTLTIAFRMQ